MECTARMRTPQSAERYLHGGRSRNPEPQQPRSSWIYLDLPGFTWIYLDYPERTTRQRALQLSRSANCIEAGASTWSLNFAILHHSE